MEAISAWLQQVRRWAELAVVKYAGVSTCPCVYSLNIYGPFTALMAAGEHPVSCIDVPQWPRRSPLGTRWARLRWKAKSCSKNVSLPLLGRTRANKHTSRENLWRVIFSLPPRSTGWTLDLVSALVLLKIALATFYFSVFSFSVFLSSPCVTVYLWIRLCCLCPWQFRDAGKRRERRNL